MPLSNLTNLTERDVVGCAHTGCVCFKRGSYMYFGRILQAFGSPISPAVETLTTKCLKD